MVRALEPYRLIVSTGSRLPQTRWRKRASAYLASAAAEKRGGELAAAWVALIALCAGGARALFQPCAGGQGRCSSRDDYGYPPMRAT